MTLIKICGLTRMADIVAVNHSLPDYIGFVFAESRRQVDCDTAAELREKLDNRIQSVGVFADHSPDYIAKLFDRGVIDIAQLHGDEDANYIENLRSLCSCQIIKALRIDAQLPSFPLGADYLLFDSGGGSGKTFDWRILRGDKAPYFLAGGLNETNVTDAIRLLRPYCVDVSSGVETNGVKDYQKIDRLVRLVRENF
ncbi:MAG: phosphoribosylanthranilate isomerase [Oscillospiraceae bacterium]|nr:phosphoribosylanthranilate isomerase [Oscillospiraceae bacterium]